MKIFIIMGRYKTTEDSNLGKKIRQYVISRLSKNDIVYDKICFAHMPKTKELLENKIDIMIDDSPTILEDMVKVCKVFLFDNRYNQNLRCKNSVRVFSWYDIYKRIKEITDSL